MGWDIDQLYKLLQQVKKNYRVDADRIYVTGLSMGGFGTWALAMKYPDDLQPLLLCAAVVILPMYGRSEIFPYGAFMAL